MFIKDNSTELLNGTACAQCKSPLHTYSGSLSIQDQFKEFFIKLFDTQDWPARWYCGNWTDFHGWLYIISDLMIWAAYFAIPILLFLIVRRREDIPFPKIFWLFIAFIFLCGSTHFIDAIIFWWPAYRLSALIRLFTGIVSVGTVYALYRILPLINNLRTKEHLEAEIEERKKAEQEARQHQILKKATEDLMHKKDEFMSIASHELKTPITSIKTSLQLLERAVEKNGDLTPVKPLVDKASNQTNKLIAIINDLLDVTKIQSGNLTLRKTEFKLRDLVDECTDECKLLEDKHISVKGDPELIVNADRARIEQVICNLITNAFKYSPDSDQVDIWYEALPGSKVKLYVKDYGIGIPEDQLKGVFDRFYRVENTSQNFSGLGLGLFICSEIIKRHDGEIGLDSKIGEGSTFWFII